VEIKFQKAIARRISKPTVGFDLLVVTLKGFTHDKIFFLYIESTINRNPKFHLPKMSTSKVICVKISKFPAILPSMSNSGVALARKPWSGLFPVLIFRSSTPQDGIFNMGWATQAI